MMHSAIIFDYLRLSRNYSFVQHVSAAKLQVFLSAHGLDCSVAVPEKALLFCRYPQIFLSRKALWRKGVSGQIEVSFLRDLIGDSTNVFGWEISYSQKLFLDASGYNYFDFRISPFRNRSEQELIVLSNSLQSFAGKRIELPLFDDFFEIGSTSSALILLGQCWDDAALIHNSLPTTFKNYAQKILEISNHYDKVFYKPHPLSNGVFEKLSAEVLRKVNAEYIDGNIYDLLGCPSYEFLAISSSAIIEAKAAGRNAFFLAKSSPIYTELDINKSIISTSEFFRRGCSRFSKVF